MIHEENRKNHRKNIYKREKDVYIIHIYSQLVNELVIREIKYSYTKTFPLTYKLRKSMINCT